MHAVNKPRIQLLAEAGDTLGQQDVVNPVLKIRVLAAEVKLAKSILGHTRRAQNYLIKGRVLTLRQRLDLFFADAIRSCAKARHDLFSRRFELAEHINRLKLG